MRSRVNKPVVGNYHTQDHKNQLLTELNQHTELSYHRTDLRICELAERLCLSARSLRRKCNEHLQVTPRAYLINYRLNKATELIYKGKAIGSIAFDVGFATNSSFGRSFKQYFGCSPTEYARKYASTGSKNNSVAENG